MPVAPTIRSMLVPFQDTEDIVFAVDSGQRIVFWNAGAEKLVGLRAEDVIGLSCHEVLQARYRGARVWCKPSCPVVALASHDKAAPTTNLQIRTRRGTVRWLGCSFVILRVNPAGFDAILHVATDLTDLVHAQESIIRLLRHYAGDLTGGDRASRRAPSAAADMPLTPRESEVLQLMTDGLSTARIAEEMSISMHTTRTHIKHVLSKLGASSRIEAVAYAKRWRIA